MRRRSSLAALLVLAGVLALSAAAPATAGSWVNGRGYHGSGRSVSVGFGVGYYPYYPTYGYYPYGWYGWYGWPYFGGAWYPPPYEYYPAIRGESGPAPAVVQTDIQPRRAQVTLDGEAIGDARDFRGPYHRLLLSPGTHTLEFSYPGYQTLRLELQVEAGSYLPVTEALAQGSGLDPRSRAVSTPRSSTAAPERHAQGAPEAKEDEDRPATGPAPPDAGSLSTGRLYLRVNPGDAAVYLDDRFLARADELGRLHGALPVAAGEHTVEVTRPGFTARRVVVDVGTESPATVQIDLDRSQ